MKLVVLNANTSTTMTEALGARAASVARPGTEVIATQPDHGPVAVVGWRDAYESAAGMIERMRSWHGGCDGLVIAGFGDVGREALRELLDAPVVDITEAAAFTAQLLGQRYGIITTLRPAVPLIRASLASAGQLERCATIRPLEVTVSDVAGSVDLVAERFCGEVDAAVAEGAEVICLGSGAFAPIASLLAELVAVPVVDGLAAAVGACEVLHHLGLRTTKIGASMPRLD